jgi:hypothetical protein
VRSVSFAGVGVVVGGSVGDVGTGMMSDELDVREFGVSRGACGGVGEGVRYRGGAVSGSSVVAR